jgi:hypothetical protein
MVEPSRVCRPLAGGALAALLLSAAASAQHVTVEQPDLIIEASGVRISPQRPAVGEEVELAIRVRNVGAAGTRARIVCELVAFDRVEDRVVARKEFEAGIHAKRVHAVRWKVRMPRGRDVRLVAEASVVSGPGDADPENNRVVVAVSAPSRIVPEASVTVTAPALPDLTITSSDILVDPSPPSPGEEVTVTAVVRNIGRADATSARANFYLYVNGTLTTRQSVADSVSMGGFTGFVWRFRMPRARQVLLSVTTGAANDGNNSNGWAEKWIRR